MAATVSRRMFIGSAATTFAALVLSACGGVGGVANTSTTAPSTPPGSAPRATRQNVLEWAKQASLVLFPSGYNSTIDPVLTTIMQSVIAGKVSVRDAATQAAQQVTALLKKHDDDCQAFGWGVVR
ncbi:MAG TPA: hypothetical protein VIU62_13320 [Chloroflexota bacterium]|jgi:hypothetical protein